MAQLNVRARNTARTHEGAPAVPALSPEKMLRRSVLSCLLWENEFYEDGATIADRIAEIALQADPAAVAALAAEARRAFNLRHVPLLLADALTRHPNGAPHVAAAVAGVIQRPDELAEFLAVYFRAGGGDRRLCKPGAGRTLTKQARRGIAKAWEKFNEHGLAKYDRAGKIKLKDVLRLSRPRPANDEQRALWKRVLDDALAVPETWETELSAGKNKREVFERLILERKLGYFALLRNLRNMVQANVDPDVVKAAILARRAGSERVLPFRYIAAARAAPMFEREIDAALCAAIGEMPKFLGKTVVLVDVSGSMDWQISAKSDLKRIDAAAALAAIIPAEDLRMFTFSNRVVEVAPRRGMGGVDVIVSSQPHSGTALGAAVREINGITHDRLIVITDEQSRDPVPDPVCEKAYMINVASNRNGVGYGRWTHIDGFSEAVLRFIAETEAARDV